MAKIRPLMIAPPLIFAALAATFYIGMQRANPDYLPAAAISRPAPALTLTPLGDGPQLAAAALQAPEVKMVNFWASWCAPCRAEHPQLQTLTDEGVTIHGINYKDEPEKAQAFLAELGSPYASLGADGEGRTALDWGLYGVPETYIIDAQGRVTFRFPGPITPSILETTIRPKLAEAAQRD